MIDQKLVRFFLPDGLRQNAQDGTHNFINKLASVLQASGFEVDYLDPAFADPRADGYSIFHMREPFARNSLTIRRSYFYPFWQIERSNERWHWEVALTQYHPGMVDGDVAQKFYGFWQKRLFEEPLKQISRDGFVYVPLQGRLLEHRLFQHCSPVEMIGHVLAQEPNKRVVAALHPKETYSEDEYAVLERLQAEYDQLEIRVGGMETLLAGCDYVVAQNSSVAFSGFFFGKPCVLFGEIDFHHIAANVRLLGIQGSFEAVHEAQPDYARYIWWFLQRMSINAGRPEAEDKIHARLTALGWKL